jgi:hypothetical protein
VLEQFPHQVELRKYKSSEALRAWGWLEWLVLLQPCAARLPWSCPGSAEPLPSGPCTHPPGCCAGRWVATTVEGRGLVEAYKTGLLVGSWAGQGWACSWASCAGTWRVPLAAGLCHSRRASCEGPASPAGERPRGAPPPLPPTCSACRPQRLIRYSAGGNEDGRVLRPSVPLAIKLERSGHGAGVTSTITLALFLPYEFQAGGRGGCVGLCEAVWVLWGLCGCCVGLCGAVWGCVGAVRGAV